MAERPPGPQVAHPPRQASPIARHAPYVGRTQCPVLVGRDRELTELTHLLTRTSSGGGGTLVLRGEAGVGKSRLVRDLVARSTSTSCLVGRCVQQGQGPYRALTEALMALARSGPLPDAAELRPFRHALGTLVPDWREHGGGETTPVLVGEGILRLAAARAGTGAALLVVEDLHWADPDTLAALEYLADNCTGQRLAVVLTVRPGGGAEADDLVARLEQRGSAAVVDVGRLGPDDVLAMVAACDETLDDPAVTAVRDRAEGLPLLVEELVAVAATGVSDAIPTTFADTVARRVAALGAESVLVVRSAAVLGRRFDWRLLPEVTGLTPDDVRRGLGEAVDGQLLVLDDDGRFAFRHALTRDALLAAMLPPARAAFARRAAAAVEAAATGAADPDTVALAADLWCEAHEPGRATRLLADAGSAATRAGALPAAERLLDRALLLAREDDERVEVLELLADVLGQAAKLERATAVGEEALTLLEAVGAPPARRGAVHLSLARAADGATRWAPSREHLDRASALADEAGDRVLATRVTALAGHVALGERDEVRAEQLSGAASQQALELDLPDVACEALEVLGRCRRLRDLDAAGRTFEQAHAVAVANGLPLWSARALHELGTIDMFQRSSSSRLQRASELAYRSGALSLAAVVDLQLVGLHGFLLELDEALAAGARAAEVADTLGMTQVLVFTHLQTAFVHAIAGRRDALELAVRQALDLAPDDREAHAVAWGHARATASLLEDDRARAREELQTAMRHARQAPGATGAFAALAALLGVVEGGGPELIEEVRHRPAQAIPINAALVDLARAAVAGREDRAREAEALVEAASASLQARRMTTWLHLGRRLLAEAALADGWGSPVTWLTEAADHFTTTGHDHVTSACRSLLRRTGHASQRRRSGPAVPAALSGSGVSRRELEVLRLLGERLSNREIAERLYLSPRTVEKHVERLLQKTGRSDRGDLGRLAREGLTGSDGT